MNKGVLKGATNIDLSILKELKVEIMIGVALVAAGFIFFKFVYMEGMKTARATDARAADARAEIARIRADARSAENLLKSVEEASANLTLLESRLGSLRERLPSDKRIAMILDEITGSRAQKRMRVIAVKPLPPEDRGELIRLPFQISAESGFFDFGGYIEMIEGLPRIIIVDNFMLELKDNDKAALTSQVYLSAYALSYGG